MPERPPGMDGWVDMEGLGGIDTGFGSDTDRIDSESSTAAAEPFSWMGASLPPGFSSILNQGWPGPNGRFSR